MRKNFCEQCGQEENRQIHKIYCDYCGKEMSEDSRGYVPRVAVPEIPTAHLDAKDEFNGHKRGEGWSRNPEMWMATILLQVQRTREDGCLIGTFDCCLDCMLKFLEKVKEEKCQTTNA